MQIGIELDASGPGSVRRELRGIAADDTLLHVNRWDLSARYLGSSRLNGTAEHAGPHVRSTLDQWRSRTGGPDEHLPSMNLRRQPQIFRMSRGCATS
jgi:hypothetical protein